jgi:pimeloyl-ACP methyl ester carboxylesterase
MIIMGLLQRLFALASLAVLAAGAYLVWSWFDLREAVREALPDSDLSPDNWRLGLGAALLAWSLLGRFLVLPLVSSGKGAAGERLKRGAGNRLTAVDSAELHVETDGQPHAPTLLLVHGWGMDSTFWCDARRDLGGEFQLVTYDLAGLGRSSQPKDGRYSLDRFADELRSVVESLGGRQVVLVGHSIGGMIVQTFAHRHRDLARTRVAGLVLENTTPEDPTKTMLLAGLIHPLEPLWRVLMRVDIVLSPLLRLMNWQSYLSGHLHLAMRLAGFGGRPARAQLDQVALLSAKSSPAVKAKGNLAMMSWSAADKLPEIDTPALVIIGGRDIVTKPEAGEEIVRGLPQARPFRVLHAGHMGPLEHAADYNRAIAAFAREVFARVPQAADSRVAASSEAVARDASEPRSFEAPHRPAGPPII